MNRVIEDNIVFYKNQNGIDIEVRINDETVWLNQEQLVKLYNSSKSNISEHIKHIFEERELDEDSVVRKFRTTASDGKNYSIKYYNLDMIVAIGFRVRSNIGTMFRKWANEKLKQYIVKGFVLNDDRFIRGNSFDKKYFDELLERIKSIRVSERMSYQKITDLFIESSVDYDKKSEEAYTFFKIVQNKLHYAITGRTAAELIFERVDSEKINLGLTTWSGSPDGIIYKYDVKIAKNYLNEEELIRLNRLTIAFLDYAEDMAEEHKIMTMKNWIDVTDKLLKFRDKKILTNHGSVSHKTAIEKAEKEYEKYRIKQDEKYVSSMDEMYNKYLNEMKTVEKK